jgi:hypothetical protein
MCTGKRRYEISFVYTIVTATNRRAKSNFFAGDEICTHVAPLNASQLSAALCIKTHYIHSAHCIRSKIQVKAATDCGLVDEPPSLRGESDGAGPEELELLHTLLVRVACLVHVVVELHQVDSRHAALHMQHSV